MFSSYVKPIWQPVDNSGNVAWHEALGRWGWQRNNRVPDPITQFNHIFFNGHDSIFMVCVIIPWMVESALLMPRCLFGTRASAATKLTYSIKRHRSFVRCASIMVDASWNIAGQKHASCSDNKKWLGRSPSDLVWPKFVFVAVIQYIFWTTQCLRSNTPLMWTTWESPASKVHVTNMGPTWGLSTPGGPHVGPMSLAIRVNMGAADGLMLINSQNICIHQADLGLFLAVQLLVVVGVVLSNH